jgi:hypothetical protein
MRSSHSRPDRTIDGLGGMDHRRGAPAQELGSPRVSASVINCELEQEIEVGRRRLANS